MVNNIRDLADPDIATSARSPEKLDSSVLELLDGACRRKERFLLVLGVLRSVDLTYWRTAWRGGYP